MNVENLMQKSCHKVIKFNHSQSEWNLANFKIKKCVQLQSSFLKFAFLHISEKTWFSCGIFFL